MGLDYHKRVLSNTSKERQHSVFSTLLSLGRKQRKPVIIHSRYAWRDSFALTKGAGVELAVFHWYTGPSNVLKEILDAGYFVSATIAAEYHAEHRRAMKEAPLDRLLLETDCPVVYQGHRSEPADVTRSLRAAAELKELPMDTVAERTTQNAVSLFGLSIPQIASPDFRFRGNDKVKVQPRFSVCSSHHCPLPASGRSSLYWGVQRGEAPLRPFYPP